MTTNTNTGTMDGTDSGLERSLTADADSPNTIVERCGSRCYICDQILHGNGFEGAENEMLAYPPHPDYPPYFGIIICIECFHNHTNDQLDEKVNEMYAHYKDLREDPGDYGKNQGRAFKRDDYTCQLCGNKGIPKAARGLIAYPVRAGDYHLNNLVTICDDCVTKTLDSDVEEQMAANRLRVRATRAKEWVNHETERSEYLNDEDENRESDSDP